MLNLNLNIQSIHNIPPEIEKGNLEKCFWVVEAHEDHIDDNKILQNKEIAKVMDIRELGSRGILYTYKIQPDNCDGQFTDERTVLSLAGQKKSFSNF
jgi:hypothetical protein